MPHPGLVRKHTQQHCATWKHPAMEILFLQGMKLTCNLNVNSHPDASVKEASHSFQKSRKYVLPKGFEAEE